MSGIPDDICGLCYHPKDSAETCKRHDCESSASPACSIALPKITEEMVENFYPWLIADDGDGYTWNQAAVDFACVLKAECFRRAEKAIEQLN